MDEDKMGLHPDDPNQNPLTDDSVSEETTGSTPPPPKKGGGFLSFLKELWKSKDPPVLGVTDDSEASEESETEPEAEVLKPPKRPKKEKKEPKKPKKKKKGMPEEEMPVINPDEMTLESAFGAEAEGIPLPVPGSDAEAEAEPPAKQKKKKKPKKEKKEKKEKKKEPKKKPAKGKKGKPASDFDEEDGGKSSDKKKGKGAPPDKEKADKKKSNKKENAVADDKNTNLPAEQPVAVQHKSHPLRLSLLISIGWLFAVCVFLLLIRFDPTEDGLIRGPVLLFLNPEEDIREDYYSGEIISNMDWEMENEIRTTELDEREYQLDEREMLLDEREDELMDREDQANEILEQYQSAGADSGPIGDQTELVAKTLAAMQSSKAADVLANMDFDKALQVSVKISAKKLAPIMAAMDPEIATELMDALIILREDLDMMDY